MQYRRYDTVINSFSGSSSEYDKSEDELSYEEYDRESKFSNQGALGSRLFRRWFLNLIDLPNTLTNRLKDWLRVPPGSQGSTSDKISGTNSVHPSEIQLNESTESDDDYYEKYNNKRRHDNGIKNYRSPGAHRPLKNHHVYHIYKQNEMGFQRSVGGQRNYSTSWLQRNERFSSSPVLVLPRIDPDTGQPIFHPRSYHSRRSNERRAVTRRDENRKSDNWRSGIWEMQTNRFMHLRGDANLIEGFTEKQSIKSSQSSLKPKKKCANNDNGMDRELDLKTVELNVTSSTAFHETISMRLKLEDSPSFAQTSDSALEKKNSVKIIKADLKDRKDRNSNELENLRKITAITQSNVDDLLKNLRQKISSLNAEKKFNNPVDGLSSLIDPESRSYGREHLFSTRWQDKSGLFAKEIRPTYAEARASFTERIQDIWIQEKTSSQWAVLHKRRTVFSDGNTKFENNEDFPHEKKINCNVDRNTRIDDNEDFEEEKEINCNVDRNTRIDDNEDFRDEKGMNCNVDRNTKFEDNEDLQKKKEINCTEIKTNGRENESLMSSFSSSKDNEISKPTVCHIAVQYSVPEARASEELHQPPILASENNNDKSEIQIQPHKPFTNSNEILIDSTQFHREIQAYSQYYTEESRDFVSSLSFNAAESKNTEKNLNSSKKLSIKNKFLFLKNAPRNVEAKNSKILFNWPLKKRLSCHLTRFTKIRLKPSIRFSRNPFVREKKSRFRRCSFPNKVRMWIAQNFQSDRRSTPFSEDRNNFYSTKSSKLGCIGNIFKCIEKTSEINVTQGTVEDVPTIVKPTPPIRRKKGQAQSSTGKTIETMFKDQEKFSDRKSEVKCMKKIEDEENFSDEKSETKCVEKIEDEEIFSDEKSEIKCVEKIEADFGAIEPEASSNGKMHGERSMTMLSVTTSNSTNIPLQLLGSTSDTTIVPSHDSQDDFKRVESPGCAEIITRKQEIETFKEADDFRTDLFRPDPNFRLDETSKIFEFNDVLKMTDNSNETIKDIEKKSSRLEKKLSKLDPKKKRLRSKENGPVNRKQRKGVKSEKIIIDKKRSLDIENLSSRKRNVDKIEKNILSDKSASPRNANNLRLERRESVIDIGVDKSSRSETKRKSAEIKNSNDRFKDRKLVMNMPKNENSDKSDRKECKSLKKGQIRGMNSIGFYPELMPASKKLRHRADSPMIPRKSDSKKKISIAAGKSNLIPVGIGNSKCLSTMRKSDEKQTFANKSKLPEKKNHTIQRYRPSLKKTSRDSSKSNGKKASNHRVHFELKNNSSKESELKVKLKKMDEDRCKNFSGNLIDRSSKPLCKIDDNRLVQKIKSSLENGMPLKRITIMDPYSVSKRPGADNDGEIKSKVEKDVIDQTSESPVNTQNLTTLMEKTWPISRVDKELVDRTYPHRESLLSEQIPKLGSSFAKRHPNDSKLSYRPRSREKNQNYSTNYSAERGCKNFKESIIDFARIKERVESEILEKTSRTSGTEDSDCAIVLIKAINSSMELSYV